MFDIFQQLSIQKKGIELVCVSIVNKNVHSVLLKCNYPPNYWKRQQRAYQKRDIEKKMGKRNQLSTNKLQNCKGRTIV